MEIKLRYESVDGVRKTRTFKTVKGAKRFADTWVGTHPDLGGSYAVSQDGIGKIVVLSGITLRQLFWAQAAIQEREETAEEKAEREWHEWESQAEWEAFGRYGRG